MKTIATVTLSLGLTLGTAMSCAAQVVQLPAVGSFGVSTTMSVPDQGTGSLGGVARSSSGSTTRGFGPLANTARGGQSSASSASVSVTFIDLAAMDEALLNTPSAATSKIAPNHLHPKLGTKIVNTLTPHHYDRVVSHRQAAPQPYDWMRALGPQGDAHLDSAENKVRDGSNVRFFMDKAEEAQNAGRKTAAQVYYAMALERMTPAQRQRLEEILAQNQADADQKTKKGASPAKTSQPASPPPAEAGTTAPVSPFDAPAATDPNTDMNSSPF